MRTLAQQEKIMADLKKTTAEIHDGWVRIEMVAKEILEHFPDSKPAKEAQEMVDNIKKRG
jgi:hypothetical protein